MTIELQPEELDLLVWLLANDRSVYRSESQTLAAKLLKELPK